MDRVGSDRQLAAAVGLLAALALCLVSLVVEREGAPRGDDLIYELIARHPFGIHTFPFGYRIGLPLLVNVLPFHHSTSFLLLSWLFAGGASAYAYLLMRELGTERGVAAALALLLAVSPPILIVALRNGRNTDVATVFFLMICTYLAVRRAYWQLAIALLLGTIFREAVLFVIPLAYALWARRLLDREAALKAAAVGLPAIVGYAALRIGIDTVGKGQVPGYSGSLIGERVEILKSGLESGFREARRLFTVYGPLWLVAPMALATMRFARRGLVLVALSVVSMTFALDWGRMILLACPVFYPASGWVLTRRRRWALPTLLAFLALAIAYAIYMDVSGVRNGIIDAPAPPYPLR